MTKTTREGFAIRDFLALPFVLLMFLFARIALTVGGVFTAEEMLKTFGEVVSLRHKYCNSEEEK